MYVNTHLTFCWLLSQWKVCIIINYVLVGDARLGLCMCVHACMRVCVCVRACACVHVCTRVGVCVGVCVSHCWPMKLLPGTHQCPVSNHTHTHTHTQALQPDPSSTLRMNDTAANKTPPPSSSPLPPERPSSALTCDTGGRERSRSDESANQPPGMRDSFRMALSSSSNSFSAEVEHTRKERDLLLYKLKFIDERLRRLESFSGSDQPSSESETTAASVISSSHPSLPPPLHSPLPPHTQALSHSTPQLPPLSPPGVSPPRHSFSMPSRYQAMPHTNSNFNRPMTSPVSQPIESSHSHPMSISSEGHSPANEPLSARQDPVQCDPGAPSALEALIDDGRDGEGGSDVGSVHKENTELKTKVQQLEKSEANLRKTVEAKEEQMARLQSEVAALQEKLLRGEEESDADRSASGRGGSPSGGTSQSASKKGSGGGKSRHNR